MRPFSGSGIEVDSEFAVESDNDLLAVILESRGGASPGSAQRNPDYNVALDLLLSRLAQLRATVVGLAAARNSPAMALLIGAEDVGRTHRAAEASELWGQRLSRVLGLRLEAAMAAGEVRDDVTVDTMVHWVTRIAFSLIAEPGRPEDGGDEGLIRAFLPACLAPRAQ